MTRMRDVSLRLGTGCLILSLAAACTEPLDFDMRGNLGGFSTAEAARSATQDRPKPDSSGVISYPNYQVAVARTGDTVATLSQRIGLPASEVANYNGLDVGDPLRAGEVVALPRRVDGTTPGEVDIAALAGSAIDAAPGSTSSAIQSSSLSPSTSSGTEPVRHQVERGETAYTIARLYDVPVKSLADWNGLDAEFSIREGQYLLIPVAQVASIQVEEETEVTQPGQGSPTPEPPSAAKPLPEASVVETTVVEETVVAPVAELTPSRSSGSGNMVMPVTGSVVRPYSKGKNDGIDIAAAPGTSVRAAEGGTVAAITADADQVPILVVRHPNNVLTVYANVEGITVAKGDTVSKGQSIAKLRDGDDAYVHFEVRNGFESVDPTPYLE
ncbi:LysM peptidoglycan-binding domain-containing M23 family metallopeptidase [Chachezhania antarctica]|uniref:LysM peptidoglycan-binding domain-containing M23 family metallopeptidase n=1 Tax=Chachezhania antarctica TaxID=2340860 RepID=UPI003083FBCA